MHAGHQIDVPQPAAPNTFGQASAVYVATVVIIALMALGSFLAGARATSIVGAAAASAALGAQARLLAERVAGESAQYSWGLQRRSDLRAAIGALDRARRQLGAGDREAGYGAGAADLDAAASRFIGRARRLAALTPPDPNLPAQSAQLFAAAQDVDARLAAAAALRRDRTEREVGALRAAAGTLSASSLLCIIAGGIALFGRTVRRARALAREVAALTELATIDPLTGSLNGRGFHARGAIEVHKARRYKRPLTLLMIDADGLPEIGNAHGTAGSETVLRALTSSLFAGTRASDLVGRVEREQFAILLPETTTEGATLLAERLRQKISALSFPIRDELVSCTVSIGVAAAETDASFLWPTFKRADEALFEAKMRGRNQVVVAA